MFPTSATTRTGIIKGIIVATGVMNSVQDELTFYIGLAYAVLTAVQGYLTKDKDPEESAS